MSVRSNGSKTSSTFDPGERGVDLVEVAVQADRRGLCDGPPFTPPERLGQQLRVRRHRWAGGEEPGQRRLFGFAVHPLVVDLFHPGREQAVQLRQRIHPGADTVCGLGDLDQELIPHGARQGRPCSEVPTCWRALFRMTSLRTGLARFPSIRLSSDYNGIGAATRRWWMSSWHASQTTRDLRRLLAMNVTHSGGFPVMSRSASFRT